MTVQSELMDLQCYRLAFPISFLRDVVSESVRGAQSHG